MNLLGLEFLLQRQSKSAQAELGCGINAASGQRKNTRHGIGIDNMRAFCHHGQNGIGQQHNANQIDLNLLCGKAMLKSSYGLGGNNARTKYEKIDTVTGIPNSPGSFFNSF